MSSDTVASRYRIVRELGRGGMGVVYLVEHLHTGEQLALKLLHGWAAEDPGVVARFKREARVGAQIKSDYVVRVTDADVAPELGGAPFFVMEMLDGLDIDKLVLRVGALHRDVVMFVVTQIAKALDRAHALGIVHRDLKPENIFLQRREDDSTIAKILDFGISKIVTPGDSQNASLGATAAGTVMGTPYYMAPEQARGLIDQISPATDVWAIGLIAHRMLTGQIYWTASTHADLMIQILVGDLARPSLSSPFLGPRFDAWFARSCAREPNDRWKSVGQQIAALGEAFGDGHYDRAIDPNATATMDVVIRALRHPVVGDAATRSGLALGPPPVPMTPTPAPMAQPPVAMAPAMAGMAPTTPAKPPTPAAVPPASWGLAHSEDWPPNATTSGRGGLSRTESPAARRGSRLMVAVVVAVAGVGIAAYLLLRPANNEVATTAVAAAGATPSASASTAPPPAPPVEATIPNDRAPESTPAPEPLRAVEVKPSDPRSKPAQHHAPRTPTQRARSGIESPKPAYDPLAP